MEVILESHLDEAIKLKDEALSRALWKIGATVERYAKELCPVDTGRLRNSIAFDVREEEEAVYVGTNVEYAPYIELGTGKFAEGGGRATPWRYQDDKGNWHTTIGMKPRPYLRPAVANHLDEYKEIAKNELKSE
jgi:HK97 gp10 family phage protein